MDIQKLLLTKNMFSRPGKKLESVRGIAIHWVANAGSSAVANRNYFESLKNQSPNDPAARCASAHFIVGIGGEIVQCVPLDEMAYHVGAKVYKPEAITAFGHYPNNCTIGIELCHPDDSGKFTGDTFAAATALARGLCDKFALRPAENIWTHHQITGKNCPKWFVDHPDEFETFKAYCAKGKSYGNQNENGIQPRRRPRASNRACFVYSERGGPRPH